VWQRLDYPKFRALMPWWHREGTNLVLKLLLRDKAGVEEDLRPAATKLAA